MISSPLLSPCSRCLCGSNASCKQLGTEGETEAQQHTQTGLQCCMQLCSSPAPSVPLSCQPRMTEISVPVSDLPGSGEMQLWGAVEAWECLQLMVEQS